jgi:dihydrofolate reductase
MSKVRFGISMSLDGYIAGPNQSLENPLGEGGEQLHEWVIGLELWRRSHGMEGGEVNASSPIVEESLENIGATVMGRNMFGGGPGPWGDDPWGGWWGDEPPFRTPVFVVTHHDREPLVKGATTFTFVTDGVDAALERAKDAAGDKDVWIAGGADIAQQNLAAGAVDEMELHVVPITLGAGARLLDNLGDEPLELERTRVVEAPGVTHLKYKVGRKGR